MKLRILTCIAVLASLAVLATAAENETPIEQLFDGKLTPTQRVNACFELRRTTDPDAIHAMSRALEDPDLLACAADNLRIAGAIEPLQRALSSENAQVRAAAARELGSFEKPELLEALSVAAHDENALVATNALAGLSQYRDPVVVPYVVPYLADLAKRGGMTGDMAIERLAQLDSATALTIARELMSSPQVPDKLYAMRVLSSFGDASDLPELKKIAASDQENLTRHDRGFGLMPPINLSRAAKAAIASIETRQ
jgi:HEAT repeat protein